MGQPFKFDPVRVIPQCARRAFPRPAAGPDRAGNPWVNQAERSLIRFIEVAWPVVEPGTRFVPNWHLDAIAEHLQAVSAGQIRNLLINIPPRHMKSLAVCVFWPAWEWITQPSRKFLFASYALSLSQRDSLKCRRLIESPWYQAWWGRRYQLRRDQNTKLRYETTGAGHRIATSVGGSATGEGGDRVVVDDPHNVVHRDSAARREQTLAWWDETMSTRLNDPKTGARVIVMQRVHEKDLSGHVLEQGGYEHLFLPAEFEPGRRCITLLSAAPEGSGRQWADPRQEEGAMLWAERVGKKELDDYKLRLGPDGYAGQFQQRPAPAGGALFRAEWFRHYRLAGSGARRAYVLQLPDGRERMLPVEECWRFAVMDPAGAEPSDGRRPCYTVIQVWDVSREGEMLLVHQYRKQVQTPTAAREAARLCREYEAAFIAIEKDGIGLGVVQQVKASGVTVRPIKARGCKTARSQTAEIRMANGQVYFPREAPYLFELKEELLAFPSSEFCDQVDALSHAAALVQKRSRPFPEPVESWQRQGDEALASMEGEPPEDEEEEFID